MGVVLITGASGFIGQRLALALSSAYEVVGLSRSEPSATHGRFVRGAFHSPKDLRALDRFEIDAVVHLAAVTGGCSDQDGLAVNVAGTQRLLRHLADLGCRKFVLASSIAACGVLTFDEPRFVPLALPIPPDHPCLARDAYGFSKALMEDVARYIARAIPDAALLALRFGAVVDEATYRPRPFDAARPPPWTMVSLGQVAVSDVVAGIALALGRPVRPGFSTMNLVGPDCCSDEAVPRLLRAYLGPERARALDLSPYERPGHEHDPVFSLAEAREELGFEPQIPLRAAAFQRWKEESS